jgi:hypothetical protein
MTRGERGAFLIQLDACYARAVQVHRASMAATSRARWRAEVAGETAALDKALAGQQAAKRHLDFLTLVLHAATTEHAHLTRLEQESHVHAVDHAAP